MRNTESGSKTSEMTSSSCFALARSWPNGFSMMTRRQASSVDFASPQFASCFATTGKSRGGTDM